MNILDGIKNFLQFINDNWTTITIIIALIIAIFEKVKKWISTSKQEKIDSAIKILREYIIKWVTEAELDYEEWVKAGAIKRAEVIAKVYETFPILKQFVNQDELISIIDNLIEESLENLKNILEKQNI